MKQASGLSLPSPADFEQVCEDDVTRLSDEDWERVASIYNSLDAADRVEWLRRCLGTLHHNKWHFVLASIHSGIGLTSGDVTPYE